MKDELIQEGLAALGKARQVTIAVPQSPTLDAIASAALLAGRLSAAGKTVSLLNVHPINPDWNFLPLVLLREKNGRNRELVITVDTREAPVGELRYEKNEGSLRIIISPREQPIEPARVRAYARSAETDLVIVLGARKLNELGEAYDHEPQLFFHAPILNIDIAATNTDFGEINLIDAKAAAVSEIAWSLASRIGKAPLMQDEATLVLAGILSRTNNFLDGLVYPETISLVADCVRGGADRASIVRLIHPRSTLPALQLWGRAAIRSRFAPNGSALFSLLTAGDFTNTGALPSDIARVMQEMERHLLPAPAMILVWQHPENMRISYAIRTRDAYARMRLEDRGEGSVRDGLFQSDRTFASFAQAESAAAQMFERVRTEVGQ